MSASSASTSRLPWPSAAYDVLVIGDLNRTQRQVTTMAIRGQHGFSGAEFFAGARGLCEGDPRGYQNGHPRGLGLKKLNDRWRTSRTHTAYQPSTPKISSLITRRGTNPAEGSRGNSRVAPTTDSLAGAPISPASSSPERGERSASQEWRQQLASSWFSPSGWNERQLYGVACSRGTQPFG